MISSSKISIYVHWPFCLHKCPYCDFNSHVTTKSIQTDEWCNAYIRELEYFEHILVNKEIKSIFFGGGTPSLMPPIIVEKIITYLNNKTRFSNNIEITLEANPTSSESAKFQSFKSAGVNRLSLGIQSFCEKELIFLGRQHSVAQSYEAIALAEKYFSRYSFDLIYALHNQTITDWEINLKHALKFANGHLSLYQLTIEEKTNFYHLYKANKLQVIDADLAADMYLLTNAIMKENHYEAYEISNYAQNGEESVHNLCYWNYDEYLGIGPGAHSRIHATDGIYSLECESNPNRWILERGKKYIALSQKEIISEIIMMGLRLHNGVDESKLLKYCNSSFKEVIDQDALTKFEKMKLLKMSKNNLQLTEKGGLLHQRIVSELI